ncbi:MAG: hypothetical protein HRU15_00950 [Planctomycetes bacterium]|nr:hypothetical protein [Planctomycetota bacterium]
MIKRYLNLLLVWFLCALIIAALELFYNCPAMVIACILWSQVVALVIYLCYSPKFKQYLYTIPLQIIILYHIVRFVGFYFLELQHQGRLTDEFIWIAWGDIISAAWAIPLCIFAANLRSTAQWWNVITWNVFAACDILCVVITIASLGLQDMSQVVEMTAFPLNMLPLFIVPLIIFSHILIFARLNLKRKHCNQETGCETHGE